MNKKKEKEIITDGKLKKKTLKLTLKRKTIIAYESTNTPIIIRQNQRERSKILFHIHTQNNALLVH